MLNKDFTVSISKGNSKMGFIPSVSLPPVITCRPGCPCAKDCYACKLCRIYKSVREAYSRNWNIYKVDPAAYWTQVNQAVRMSHYFRFHVSGDIPDGEYFANMVRIAANNPGTRILAFTKQYEIVNDWIDSHGDIPTNLQIVFSGWRGLKMDNPHNLPESHVRFKDGYCEAGRDAIECPGNCTECCVAGCGCWSLMKGESVVFNQH